MASASLSLGQVVLIGLAFSFAVGISFGIRRRRAQLALKAAKKAQDAS